MTSKSAANGFDINRSRIGCDTLARFLAAPITKDLSSVPGVGDVTIERLNADNITTTHQLIGAYLRVCGVEFNSQQRTDAFWFYLQKLNVPGGTRSTIVHAIVERVNIMIPGVCVGDLEGVDEEEEDDDN